MASYCLLIFSEPPNESRIYYSSLGTGDLRHDKNTGGKKPPVFRIKSLFGRALLRGRLCLAERSWRLEQIGEKGALAELGQAAQPSNGLDTYCSSSSSHGVLVCKDEWRSKLRSRTETWRSFLCCVDAASSLSQLQFVFIQIDAVSSADVVVQCWKCTSAQSLLSSVTRFGTGRRRRLCFAMGACFLLTKLIMWFKKTMVRVYWPVADGLWDSGAFCVGTSVEGNGLGRGKSTRSSCRYCCKITGMRMHRIV